MDMKPMVLIIEDEEAICNFISAILTSNGYQVVKAKTGREGLSLFTSHVPDIILLDLGLPDIDGTEILKTIRQWSKTPVIVVSARGHEREKVAALDFGADDYIEKPYDIDVLIAKIKGIFKRRYQHDILSADGVTLNLADKTAVIDGKPVELPSKEFDLLALLIENQGKVLKKSYLFGAVWGSDSDSELQTLHVHINRIRQKLGDDPKNAKRLLTIWGVGYKFV